MPSDLYPKYLVELDRAEASRAAGGNDDLPATPLWVARLRHPFALGLVDATPERADLGTATIILWGAGEQRGEKQSRLINGLVRALFREYDLRSADWAAPEIVRGEIAPPEFLMMVKPGSRAEFVLEPRAPHLWRIKQHTADWVRGFGQEPQSPRDTRRIAAFLMQ